MEINDLIIFKTVANKGSISKAAQELGYVQPNVTERIKKLEEELETQLLHRSSKGVSLQPSGAILLEYADKILDLLNEAKNQIKSEPEYYRIATTETILSNYLSVRIKDELEKFQIYILGSSQLKNPLKEKKVDLVISYNDYADSEFKKLFSTNISIGLLKSKVKTDVNFLEEFFLVSHDKECPFRKCTIKFMEENHIPKKQLQLVDSYSFMKELVSQGKGIAFLPIQEPSERIEEILREAITLHFFTTKSSEKLIPKSLIE